jgi:hypothetical protein
LKSDGRRFEVFYILTDTECFADDSEIDFSGVVGSDGGGWIGFAEKVPDVRLQVE